MKRIIIFIYFAFYFSSSFAGGVTWWLTADGSWRNPDPQALAQSLCSFWFDPSTAIITFSDNPLATYTCTNPTWVYPKFIEAHCDVVTEGYDPVTKLCSACVAPSVLNTATHMCSVPCVAGQVLSSGLYEITCANCSPPISTCSGNCSYTYEGSSGGFSAIVGGVLTYYAQGSYGSNGFNCSAGDPAAPSSTPAVPPDSCPAGEVMVQNAYGFICSLPALNPDGTPQTATASGTSNTPAPGGTPTQSTTTSTSTTTTNPDGSTTTTTTATTTEPPIQFPSDYATTGEAMAAARFIDTSLTRIHSDLSVTTTLPQPPAVDFSLLPSASSSFTSLLGWTVPVHASTCPSPSVDLSGVLGAGKIFYFSAHCDLVRNFSTTIQAAMIVVWSMLALFIVLRA